MNPYNEALLIQDACNGGGVVHAFSRAIEEVQIEARNLGKGTDYVNTHPVMILFLDKLCSLAHYPTEGGEKFGKAYDICCDRKDLGIHPPTVVTEGGLEEGFFRGLSVKEVQEFRAWADENFVIGQEPQAVWHPVVRDRWAELQVAYDKAELVKFGRE